MENFEAPAISLASMAMLVELRISTWTARKRDKETTADLNTAKEADQDASSVYKYLMAGSDHLNKIEKYAAKYLLSKFHFFSPNKFLNKSFVS